jgi:hypothetical protein
VFVLVSAALSISILIQNPLQSVIGLAIIAAGVPVYFFFRNRAPAAR